jgi:hypothetical protein
MHEPRCARGLALSVIPTVVPRRLGMSPQQPDCGYAWECWHFQDTTDWLLNSDTGTWLILGFCVLVALGIIELIARKFKL